MGAARHKKEEERFGLRKKRGGDLCVNIGFSINISWVLNYF